VVLQVLYLIFNEGYTTSSGPNLHRAELTGEAIRLTRAVRRLLPDDGEVAGLLALMLLTDARRPARTRPDGALVPLAEQDRDLWVKPSIDEGVALLTRALAGTPLGPYQLQAAIAAVHAEAGRAPDTDWPEILASTSSWNGSPQSDSLPEQRYLQARAARLAPRSPQP
jgi:predicted RNA polymerase sigma factor